MATTPISSRVPRIKFVCPNCGAVFFSPPSQATNREACSRACKAALTSRRAKARALTFDMMWALAMPEPNSGCLLWMQAISDAGYGRHKNRQAHALAYELAVGAIPVGHEIDHTCRVRCCINPMHLEPVTHLENLRRSPESILTRLGDASRARTHCPQGHPYEGDNIFVTKRGSRQCRICMRAWRHKSYRKIPQTRPNKEATPNV